MSLADRFFRYAAISSQSDASSTVVPSSDGQWELARLLQSELAGLGLSEIHLDEHCCLTALLPGNDLLPAVGFLAHLDTADVNIGADVTPRIVRFDGEAIELGGGQVLEPSPEMSRYLGEDIIVTDGTSVLGADDKSAIATIVTALETIIGNDLPHPTIHVAFVPDEEIGLRGAKVLDLARFCPEYAYTIDCEGEGTIAYETFNAGYAHVEIVGVSAHPMSAKGNMVNPNLVAHDLISCFDRDQTPEMTEGRQGYIWVQQVSGNQATASVLLNIRDHDLAGYEAKKAHIEASVEQIRARHPRAQVSLEIEDVYGNIADALGDDQRWVVDKLEDAVRAEGLEVERLIMRGGTDGSYLSTQGIPTPNIFTGGYNFHSVREFLPLSAFEASYRVVLRLMQG